MEVSYSAIRDDLKTGDIVLFSGKGGFSDIIKYGTLSKFSHVGMVLRIPEYDFLTVWESTTLVDIKDLELNRPHKGVQLVPLSDRVQKYSGGIAIRKLQGPELPVDSLRNLMALRKELRGKRYESDKIELIKSAYDGFLGNNSEDLSSIFCSELVAEAYQSLGLLDPNKPSNEYTPADFTAKRMDQLCGGFCLSEEMTIKND